MYKLEFTLKQHTPLIHFQHEQAGATLRATEVKPKLDKFLFANYNLFEDYKGFLIGYSELEDNLYRKKYKERFRNFAFDYKLKIISSDPVEISLGTKFKNGKWETDEFPFFIANMGGKEIKEELKNFVLFNNIKLVLTSAHKQLLSDIEKLMKYFLVYTNFGNRESKGFGCFYLKDEGIKDFNDILLELNNENVYYKNINNPSQLRSFKYFEYLFKTVSKDYQILKSGNRNTESLLKKYFDEQGVLWEKLAIKLHLNSEVLIDDFAFIRIILGLADHHEYMQKKFIVKIKESTGEILRFKSPLTIKFFDSTVYIIPEEIPEEIYDRNFIFSFINDDGEFIEPLELKTPSNPGKNFLIEFLDENLPKLNYKNLINYNQ